MPYAGVELHHGSLGNDEGFGLLGNDHAVGRYGDVDNGVIIEDHDAFAGGGVVFGGGDDHLLGLFDGERREGHGLAALDVQLDLVGIEGCIAGEAIAGGIQHAGKAAVGAEVFDRDRYGFDGSHSMCASLS